MISHDHNELFSERWEGNRPVDQPCVADEGQYRIVASARNHLLAALSNLAQVDVVTETDRHRIRLLARQLGQRLSDFRPARTKPSWKS